METQPTKANVVKTPHRRNAKKQFSCQNFSAHAKCTPAALGPSMLRWRTDGPLSSESRYKYRIQKCASVVARPHSDTGRIQIHTIPKAFSMGGRDEYGWLADRNGEREMRCEMDTREGEREGRAREMDRGERER